MNCKSEIYGEEKFSLKMHETCKMLKLYREHIDRMFLLSVLICSSVKCTFPLCETKRDSGSR